MEIFIGLLVFSLVASVVSPLGEPNLKGLSWENCGKDTDPVKIIDLKGTIKGKFLLVSGVAKVGFDLDSPIKAEVDFRKKILGTWMEIPCIDNFGSCTYKDICSIFPLDNSDCFKHYKLNHLPCQCPIQQGIYFAKNFPIDLSGVPHWLEKGSYKIKVNVSNRSEQLMCLLLALEI